jgi:hypothetical protein
MVMKSTARRSRAEHAGRAQEYEPADAGRSRRAGSRLHEADVGTSKLLHGTGGRFAQNVGPSREVYQRLHALEPARQIRRTDILPTEGNYVITERTQGWAKMPSDEARGSGYCDVTHAAPMSPVKAAIP